MINSHKGIKKIAVFGSSWPIEGQEAYQQAYCLGQLITKANYITLNGGYLGTMEAVSRGAYEKGGYVIGFPCDEIENFRPVKPNKWLCEEIRYPTLRSRLMAMIDSCDAAISLPGGIGTLAEVFMMWNHLLIRSIPVKPLILIGSEWQDTVQQLFLSMDDFIPPKQRELINITPDNESAVNLLKKLLPENENYGLGKKGK